MQARPGLLQQPPAHLVDRLAGVGRPIGASLIADQPEFGQPLARAALFRLATDNEWARAGGRITAEQARAYEPLLALVRSVTARPGRA